MLRAACLLLLVVAKSDAFGPSALPLAKAKSDGLRVFSSSRCRSVGPLMMARKPFIAGNWKMNPLTAEEVQSLATAVAQDAATSPAEVSKTVNHENTK